MIKNFGADKFLPGPGPGLGPVLVRFRIALLLFIGSQNCGLGRGDKRIKNPSGQNANCGLGVGGRIKNLSAGPGLPDFGHWQSECELWAWASWGAGRGDKCIKKPFLVWALSGRRSPGSFVPLQNRISCPNFFVSQHRFVFLSFFWMQNHNGTWAPQKIPKKSHALIVFHVLVPETHVPTFLKFEIEHVYHFFGCRITMEHGPQKKFPKNFTPSSRSMCWSPRHMSQLS